VKLILLIIVLTEAIYEGLYDRGVYKPKILYGVNVYKILSKFVQALFICSFFYLAYKQNWDNKYIIIYLLFRISLFNYVNALAAWRTKLLGGCIIDRIMFFITGGQLWFYILITAVCLIIGIWL